MEIVLMIVLIVLVVALFVLSMLKKKKITGELAQMREELKVGDKVITGKYSGTEVKLDGEEYTIVRQNEILAIVE